jgi:FKBP-type peptidyl-prolyl cis-trans isomerase FkpA
MRALFLFARLLVVAIALIASGCDTGSDTPIDPSDVDIEYTLTDLVVGTGNPAAVGNVATINYTGWLFNGSGTESKGRQFASSAQTGAPLVVAIGRRQTLPGVEQAIVGMRLGGKRRAYVPANLGYGPSGTSDGTIPPNAALVFELELINLVQ